MSKKTTWQGVTGSEQPFTVVTPVISEEFGSQVFQVTGFTREQEPDGDGGWVKTWERHDLGQVANRELAFKTAQEWRAGLVGNYPLA